VVFIKSRGKAGTGRQVFCHMGLSRSGINMGYLEKRCCEFDVVVFIVLGERGC